ncbi:MAG: ComF family protein [Hylemonella sp.]|uniref:ComF family protein n=1 Tax=Hylemonella sp. TaxID=2066020 RepID=UPI00391B0339
MFRALLHRLSAALPGQCALCHAWPAQPLCAPCRTRFARPGPRCLQCARPVPAGVTHCGACLREPPPLDQCLAAVNYEYPWSSLIARYKFGPHPGWSGTLAGLMRGCPGGTEALDRADLLLPLPLSGPRLRARGFNQALELARQLAPEKTRPDLLLRLRDTPAQSSLSLEQRLRNVRDVFGLSAEGARAVQGRRLLLVDDVMTTGATLHAAAGPLRAAGAAHIAALVLARTA